MAPILQPGHPWLGLWCDFYIYIGVLTHRWPTNHRLPWSLQQYAAAARPEAHC